MKPCHVLGLLQNLPLFQGLDDGVVATIASQADVVRVLKRDVIYRKGDACVGFYVVSYGRVRLSLFSSKGLEKPIQIAGRGNSFGEATMFQELPHYTTAIAAEDSGLVFVPQAVVVTLLQADWRLGMRMLANLSYRLHLMVDDIDDFLLQPPGARLASYLLRLSPADGGGPSSIRLELQKRLVAAQLNLTPETLSRYFREFSDAGLITLEGSHVTIHSIDGLRCYVAAETHAATSLAE
ncbi:Crp/Fnr family transcriptional regulator [Aquincola sp. MAHUQ-54]|uniref:Crp/Fnr family transcriptional regulator n=1 Tax=Aquincola agrisoli TaxID=3119538 RepID=A0AAW9Q439_9BURK